MYGSGHSISPLPARLDGHPLLLLLDAPSPLIANVRTHTLATLTEQQGRPFQGRRTRYHVELDSPVTEINPVNLRGGMNLAVPGASVPS
jgi:hypothetical protein